MNLSKESLLAAAQSLRDDISQMKNDLKTINPEDVGGLEFIATAIRHYELAAHLCRLTAHASDGFEEWFVNTDFAHKDLHLVTWQAATLAASAKYAADLRDMCAEVRRLEQKAVDVANTYPLEGGDLYLQGRAHTWRSVRSVLINDRPPRVREILEREQEPTS